MTSKELLGTTQTVLCGSVWENAYVLSVFVVDYFWANCWCQFQFIVGLCQRIRASTENIPSFSTYVLHFFSTDYIAVLIQISARFVQQSNPSACPYILHKLWSLRCSFMNVQHSHPGMDLFAGLIFKSFTCLRDWILFVNLIYVFNAILLS